MKKPASMGINWGRRLPPHIAKVIFSKLSVSNLPTCRIVCKTWNNLVLDYAATSPKCLPNAFFSCTSDLVLNATALTRNRWYNPKMHCIDIDTKHLEWTSSVASFRFFGDWSSVFIASSCNGLLFVTKSTYDVWFEGIFNPMTNEFISVPPQEVEEDIYGFGLGFSPRTKQYKLFRVDSSTYLQESSSTLDVVTFGRSSGTNHNQWSHLHRLPCTIDGTGAYLNGVIYWIGKDKDREYLYVIYALDVETEQIERSAFLEVGPYFTSGNIQLFNGSVYVTCLKNPPTSKTNIQVWRMKEKGSWIIEFVIEDVPNDWTSFELIKAFEEGEILCKVSPRIFCSYNPKTGRKKIKALNQNEKRQFCHLESLNFDSLSNILAGEPPSSSLVSSKSSKMERYCKRSMVISVAGIIKDSSE